GYSDAGQHSQCVYGTFAHLPGMKVVAPSNAYDAKGLLKSAIRDDDPVVFFEHKALYPRKMEVPEEEYLIPIGEAAMPREGDDVTVVAIGRMVNFAEKTIDKLGEENITCDLIDPRTLSPLDDEMIFESLGHTGRLVIVDESPPRCSIASDIAGTVASQAFDKLKAPVKLVTAPHTPVPFAKELERAYIPGPDKIEAAIREVLSDG
ncbi:MAG: alpha-ketoacid dehydrogenase subunit beta, partial [Gammaproteobacteria bacterium]